MTAITRRSFIAVTGAMALSLMGCGGNGTTGSAGNPQPKAEPEPEPLDLSGTWKAEGEDPDSWQEIIISGNTMTINWVSDGGDTKALYWAGTYTAPSEPSDTWSWTSENDHEQTETDRFTLLRLGCSPANSQHFQIGHHNDNVLRC